MKRISNKKILWIVLLVISIVIFLIAVAGILYHYIPHENPVAGYREETVNNDTDNESQENPVDFAALQERNPDICAWIYIPGSETAYNNHGIDYPILQSGEDKEEDFYLTHDLDGKSLFDGSIYIQRINDKRFTDPNTLVYGHDLYNLTMFTPLRKYRNRDFFDANQYIYIYTPGHILKYHIYSAFVYDDRHIMYSFNFFDDDEYSAFLQETLNPTSSKGFVREGVEVTTEDQIITLSTCTNRETERFLVVGVLVEDTVTKQ